MSSKDHCYHILEPSPWPLFASFSTFFLVSALVLFMHGGDFGVHALVIGGVLLVSSVVLWWSDVIKEAMVDKAHNAVVRRGLSIGMLLFIVSEAMFFFTFFWSFFKAWLAPLQVLDEWEILENIWPPKGIVSLDPWTIPYINTLILLLSGTTVTWAHHELISNNVKKAAKALFITVALGAIFVTLQAFEYMHTDFKFNEEGFKSIYSSNFYMTTGFHGFHVIVGLVFLIICLIRTLKGHFTAEQHVGLEFAAWYWHFVDVVWIFLFVFLYWLSGS